VVKNIPSLIQRLGEVCAFSFRRMTEPFFSQATVEIDILTNGKWGEPIHILENFSADKESLISIGEAKIFGADVCQQGN